MLLPADAVATGKVSCYKCIVRLCSIPSFIGRRSTRWSNIDQRPLTCGDGGPCSLSYAPGEQTSQGQLVGISVLRIRNQRVLGKDDISITHLLYKRFY